MYEDAEAKEYELEDVIRQKPNRKFLNLARLNLWFYNLSNPNKENGWNNYLRKIGEPPSILDTNLTQKSVQQLQLYLNQKGYFEAKIYAKTRYLNKRKAMVVYHVESGTPHTFGKIKYTIQDSSIAHLHKDIIKRTQIKPGENYNVELLANERNRITAFMNNNGYYEFMKQYVYFEVDSTKKPYKVDVNIIIKSPEKFVNRSETEAISHQKWYINSITINSDYQADQRIIYDSLQTKEFLLLFRVDPNLNPNILLKNLQIHSGDLYSKKNIEDTYNKIAALGIYKFININPTPAVTAAGDSNKIDIEILLTPASKQSFSLELEGNNKSEFLGIASNFTYANKNALKGAELLRMQLFGGADAQVFSRDSTILSNTNINNSFFNTLEFGGTITLEVPELLFFKKTQFNKTQRATRTIFSLTYSNIIRPDYTGRLGNLQFGYSWRHSKKHLFTFYPLDASYVFIDKSTLLDQRLSEINNPFLNYQYNSHMLPAAHFGYSYTNKTNNSRRNYSFFRAELESAGSLLRGFHNLVKSDYDVNDSYTFFDVQYAHYVRTEADLRLYKNISKNSKMVYRFFGGIGIPLKNLEVLPFEKSYFGGGSNGMRGWGPRTLGLGSMNDTLVSGIDRFGDLHLEINAEYRFKITKLIEGALFADAGNIWLTRKDELRPNAEINIKRLPYEFALDGGAGVRLNFSFLILRFDFGTKIYKPNFVEGNRWIGSFENPEPVRINLGIGYPF